MSLNKNNLTLFFFIFFIGRLMAQQTVSKPKDSLEVESLSEVFITGTRTLRQLSSLPLPAQIISKKQIQNINSVRLSNVLGEQTGLITVPDFGGGEGIQLQGLDSQYTLILIDGVPLIGRLAGTLDLNRITVGNIQQIEVVKGASSSLYGSEALGGVVNIITEIPKEGLDAEINYRQSSFNTSDLSTSLSHKKEQFSINGFLNRFSSDGYNLGNNPAINTVEPFENYTLNTKIGYELSEKTDAKISLRYFTQNQNFVASEALRGESDINEWNALLLFNHEFNSKWQSTFEFYSTRYKTKEFLDDDTGNRFSHNFFNQLMIRPEGRATFKLNENNEFVGGIGLTHETLDRTNFSTTPVFNAPYIYAQWDAHLNDQINVIVGARYDSHNEYESQLSPKAALRYEVNNKLAIKGSVGYGFKAPDFRQLYFDFNNTTVGYTVLGYNVVEEAIANLQNQGQIANILVPVSQFDSALKAESSVSFNLGFDYDISSSVKLNVNAFRNNITNLIDTQIIANKTNGQNVFSYFNISEVYTQGLEFNASWKPNNELSISGGYQLLYAKDKEAEAAFSNGEVFARQSPTSPAFQLSENDYFGLLNRSRHMANFKVFYNLPQWKLSTNLRLVYRSKFGLFDSNGNGYLDNFDSFVEGNTVVNLAVNKTLFDNYKLGIGADNLFNFTDAPNIPNVPGRIIYVTLNFQL